MRLIRSPEDSFTIVLLLREAEAGGAAGAAAVEREDFNMKLHSRQKGQAIAEMVAGLIAFAVLFLSVFVLGDLCRARMKVALECRAEAGPVALGGLQVGSPQYFGAAGSEARLTSEVLAPAESPVTYSTYISPSYPYIQKNIVAPFYNPGGSLIGNFKISVSEKSETVDNAEFLVNYGVGPATITDTEKASMPAMKNFD